ncbi:MAG TPA: hypothetical protein VIS48_15360 [Candidatus Kryptonia bacterium]
MVEITDEYMKKRLSLTRTYCLCILKSTPKRNEAGVDKIVWEHGRRNFSLLAEGILPIVCPVADGSDVSGIGIFDRPVEEVRRIMDGDPAVKAGLFTYELYTCRGFPGSALP